MLARGLVAAIVVLAAQSSRAADLVFSGGLEGLAQHSISICLDDRRVIEARLPAASRLSAERLATQYKFGDRVEIACKRIQPAWDDDVTHFQFLELIRVRFLREPTPPEIAGLLRLWPWRDGTNLLRRPEMPARESGPPAAEISAIPPAMLHALELARQVNLERAAHLPNYVADETARRYTDGGDGWRLFDTIEAEVAIQGNRASRREIRRNGEPWKRPFQALAGFKWSGGFGTELLPLFDPQCPTVIDYEKRAEVNGKELLEYTFRSPADGCFAPFYNEYQRFNPARAGHVLIDASTGDVMRLDEDATGFPIEFEFVERQEQVRWDVVKIGEAAHLLPVAATFEVSYVAARKWRVEVQYRNHRHFESSSSITFH